MPQQTKPATPQTAPIAPGAAPRPPDAILVAGPTASGKSAVALALAERYSGTIINADSMQVYGELRVLTARPSEAEERRVPHCLYGVVSAREPFSVGRWLGLASEAIEAVRAEGRMPILAGGTGLYFKALLEGLAAVPDIPDEVRTHWRERAARLSPAALHQELAERDPVMAERLAATDPQRLVRALEVIDATGISLAEWQQAEAAAPLLGGASLCKLVIAPERAALYAKIEQRFDAALADGAIEEVSALLAKSGSPDFDAGQSSMLRAHGVPEIAAMLRGDLTPEEASRRAKTNIRRYAKRQLTWARRFMADWQWFEDPAAAVAWAENHWPAGAPAKP